MKRALVILALLFVGPLAADDSPVEPVKKPKAVRSRPKPSPTPCPACPSCPPPEAVPCPGDSTPPPFDESEPPDIFVPPVTRLAEPPVVPVVKLEVPEAGLKLGLQAWSLAAISGAAGDEINFGGRILADGPIANTWGKALRMFARLDISQLPGQTFDITSVETFGRSAELRGGAYLRLASAPRFAPDDSLEQHITTSVVAWGGFATMLSDGTVGDRYLRSMGVGLRLAEEVSGAELIVGYCRDESAGYIGFGQACVSGSVPIGAANGAIVFGGNAILNLSDASVTPQRDILRLWIGVDPGRLIR